MALLVGELTPKAVRVKLGLALLRRQLTKIAKGVGNHPAALFRELAELLHRAAKLLALVRSEPFHQLGTLRHPLALLERHIVELDKLVAKSILGLRRKLTKARFVLQGTLLLPQGKVAVPLHPLRQMLLVRSWTARATGPRTRSGMSAKAAAPPGEPRLSRKCSRSCRQKQSCKGWLEDAPEWS
jgi:hypothetical protein